MKKITIHIQNGLSPVIGVILLVAITVFLVTLATFIVFDIGESVDETSDIAINVEETKTGVNVDVIRNENVNKVRVIGPDDSETVFDSPIGANKHITGESGSYTIIAILDNGNEETIQTVNVNNENKEITGTVSVNPKIENATVEAYENGKLIDETQTDSNGEYTLTVLDSEQTKIVVSVDRFEYESNGENKILSGTYSSTENFDFEFDDNISNNNVFEYNIDNETIIISNMVDENDVIKIGTLNQLQAMNKSLDKNYKLIRDIDASYTGEWNKNDVITEKFGSSISTNADTYNLGYNNIKEIISATDLDDNSNVIDSVTLIDESEGIIELEKETEGELQVEYQLEDKISQGFNPIGPNFDNQFTGSIDGQDYHIKNLHINKKDKNNVGLKGVSTGNISNINVINTNIIGANNVSNIIGYNEEGNISNVYATGNSTGINEVGGIIGYNDGGNVHNSSADVDIYGSNRYAGGLIGYNDFGEISNSYSKGDVSGKDNVGGLSGDNDFGSDISNSYATGDVNGEGTVGGLTGFNGGEITNSYSTGEINGDIRVGGLVGQNWLDIRKSYSTGNVDGNSQVGGLVGYANDGIISNSYTHGNVNGNDMVGGIVGRFYESDTTNVYAIGEVTGDKNTGNLIGLAGRDSEYADNDRYIQNSYVLDSESNTENKVIGSIVEDKGEGDTIIKHGETILANDGNTFVSDIEQDLIDEFVRSQNDMTGTETINSMNQFDFDNTWNVITDDYPKLEWEE